MIVRFVKMTFRPEEVEPFQKLFEGWRHRIIAFPGCRELELLHDIREPAVFFTRSVWESPDDLEAYRGSAVFADVWPVVKSLFAARAEAWSLHTEHMMKASNT
ncbi:MAG: antibiotic biosynthesis monooxygenase family protein [Flavobacteriales bacterium]